jgi:hypothetical protein
MLTYLKSLWAMEPVRSVLYTVLTGLVGILLIKAGFTSNVGDLIDAIIAAVLGIPATEIVRSQVWPSAKVAAITAPKV